LRAGMGVLLLVANGEWRMANGEWGVGSGEVG
jgi:hypothetical protein